MNTPTIQTNGYTFAALDLKAKELGEQAGKGKDTQIKFLLSLAEGAFHAQINLDANKHGPDKDDATKLVETYVQAQSSAVVFDAKAPNQRKAISCARTSIKLGSWTKGGTGQPLGMIGDFMTIRQKLRADPANAKKLDDAANAFLRMARTQIKRDQLLSDAELRQFCFKPVPSLNTLEDFYVQMRGIATSVKAGKAAYKTVSDQAPEITEIIAACTKRLTEIAKAKGAKNIP